MQGGEGGRGRGDARGKGSGTECGMDEGGRGREGRGVLGLWYYCPGEMVGRVRVGPRRQESIQGRLVHEKPSDSWGVGRGGAGRGDGRGVSGGRWVPGAPWRCETRPDAWAWGAWSAPSLSPTARDGRRRTSWRGARHVLPLRPSRRLAGVPGLRRLSLLLAAGLLGAESGSRRYRVGDG